MNKKGQEFSFIAVIMALIAGVLAWFMANRVEQVGWFIPIASGIATFVLSYFIVARMFE